MKCRSSCSWNQIKTVCSVNRRYFFFQLASGITFTLRSCCEISRVQELKCSSKSTFLLQIFKIQMSFKNIIFSANSAKNSLVLKNKIKILSLQFIALFCIANCVNFCFFSGIFNVYPVLHSNTGCLLKILYWKSIMASYWVKKQLDTKTNMNTVQFRS